MEITELEAAMIELADRMSRSAAQLIAQLDIYDAREGYKRSGCASAAHWLAFRCDWSLKTAREHLRIARALRNLPQIKRAFDTGVLSYAQTRAITRIATPSNEESLLRVADTRTASQLEHYVRDVRTRQSCADTGLQRRMRSVRTWHEGGLFHLHAIFPAREGATMLAALTKAAKVVEADPAEASAEDLESSRMERRTADALAYIAQTFVAGSDTVAIAPSTQVMVHVDPQTRTAHYEDGPSLDTPSLERALCDAVLMRVTRVGNRHLELGRSTRVIRPALRSAILSRHTCCRWPGCPNKVFLEIHHVIEWARGGPTSLQNLVPLCSFHHVESHSGRFRLRMSDDLQLIIVSEDGSLISEIPNRTGRMEVAAV